MNLGLEWLIIAYVVGSVATFILSYKAIHLSVIGKTIDKLCKDGYIRYEERPNGEIELFKYNDTNECTTKTNI